MCKRTSYLVVAVLTVVMGVGCSLISIVNRVERETRELALRTTLNHTRKAIDQFWVVKGALPRSLDDLVSTKLIDKIPVDPVTNTEEWQLVIGTKTKGSKQVSGIVDLHSTSSAISSDGTPYNRW
jgi:general secretion pathway protein G